MCLSYHFQVQQYKHERECNSIIAQTREDKILRLESLMDGILPTEDFMEEELVSLTHEHKVLVLQEFTSTCFKHLALTHYFYSF